MSDATPVLYALIVFLAILVVFLMARLTQVSQNIRLLKKTLRRLEGQTAEEPDDDTQDDLGI